MDRNEKMIIELKNIIRYLIVNIDGMDFALHSINNRLSMLSNFNEPDSNENLAVLSDCRALLLDCEKQRVLDAIPGKPNETYRISRSFGNIQSLLMMTHMCVDVDLSMHYAISDGIIGISNYLTKHGYLLNCKHEQIQRFIRFKQGLITPKHWNDVDKNMITEGLTDLIMILSDTPTPIIVTLRYCIIEFIIALLHAKKYDIDIFRWIL